MKYLIHRVSLILLVVLVLSACEDRPAQLKVSMNEINMGSISGQPNNYQFTIQLKNIGDQLLLIEDIRSSCSCVQGHADEMLLKGKEKTKLIIDIDTSSFPDGEIYKELRIYSNSINSPESIRITGTMLK